MLYHYLQKTLFFHSITLVIPFLIGDSDYVSSDAIEHAEPGQLLLWKLGALIIIEIDGGLIVFGFSSSESESIC